jgi:4-amino-4-deoxy-L-arabinose transferase-like glycosyltransferase
VSAVAEPPLERPRGRQLRGIRGAGRDPLPLLLAVAAGLVYALHGFDATLTRDLGVYAYAGVTVADGVPPYVGIFNRAGPLAHVLPAVGVLAARLVGGDEVMGMRLFYLVLAVASVPVAYLVARDMFGSRGAGVAAAVTLAAYPAVIVLAGDGPREKTPMVLLMLLALWALVHRRWFVSGVLIALATLVLQIALFPLLPPAVAAACALPDRGRRLRALAAVGAGGATTLGITVAFFALVGHVRDLLDGFLRANAFYTRNQSALVRLPQVWGHLREGYGILLLVFLGSLLVLPLLAVVLVRARNRRAERPSPALAVGVAAGAAVGVLWTLRDFDSWPDTYPLLPFSVLGVAAAAWLLQERADRRVALVATAGWTVLALGLGATYAVADRSYGLDLQRRSVAVALSVLPGARIRSLEAPEALVLADQRNPSRHQMFSGGLVRYVGDTWPGGFRGFARSVRHGPQQLVAVDPTALRFWAPRLAPRYEPVGRAPGIQWFVDTRLDPSLRHRLHEALRSVRLDARRPRR